MNPVHNRIFAQAPSLSPSELALKSLTQHLERHEKTNKQLPKSFPWARGVTIHTGPTYDRKHLLIETTNKEAARAFIETNLNMWHGFPMFCIKVAETAEKGTDRHE